MRQSEVNLDFDPEYNPDDW